MAEVLSMDELLKKTREISAAKRKSNIGKPGVIPTETTSGIIGDPSSFKTTTKEGDIVDPSQEALTNLNSTLGSIKQPTTTTTTAATTEQAIVDARKQAAVDAFKSAFQQTSGRLTAEQEALTPRFREERAGIGTQDTMSRARTEKGLAGLGLSGAGAAPQSDLAQTAITQGAMSQSRGLEQQLRADIERRITEAQQLRDQGIAGAESDAEIMALQNQLNQLEKTELDAKIAEEQAKSDYLTTIGQFAGDFMAEIQRVQNDGDPSNDWQIPFLQAARQEKIATGGLDQQGQPLDSLPTYSQALEAYRMGIRSPQVMEVLNASGFTPSVGGVGGGVGGATPEPTVDTGRAGEITGYNELEQLLNQGTITGEDPNTGIPTYSQTDELGKIRQIRDNYAVYAEKFGQEAVDKMVEDLYNATLPQETEEVGAVEEVAQPTEAEQYATDYPYSQAKSEILNASDQDLQTLQTALRNQAQLLIDAYGDSDYNKLVKIVNDRWDELYPYGG